MRKRGGEKLLRSSQLVFDTGPIFLYLAEDKQVREMFTLVRSGSVDGYTCETNLAEFYYKTCEKFGRQVADIRHTSIRESGLIIVPPDERLTHIAGELKCAYRGRISLADAYTIAVAKVYRGELVTTDPQIAELKITPTKLIKIPQP